MCGISGFISTTTVQREAIERMNRAIAHRGPDGDGIWLHGNVGFGHRRLAIIDLAAGQQPMVSDDERYCITFNGEIYNYRDLRASLADKYAFRTHSDTEVILNLYREKGVACVNELRGMFAFAIADRETGTVFIARDHLGQKPLFYWHGDNELAFCSEIKGILALKDSLRQLNPEALHEYFTTRVISPPRTMFRDIHKLPPAHYLLFADGKLTIERYWELSFRNKLSYDMPEMLDQLDGQIKESVKYHLESDVPVGAFLSGGLDSGLIVGMMSAVGARGFSTFAGDVPYKTYSELPYARAVAERYQTNIHEHRFVPSLVRDLPTILWHMDEPSDSLSAAMYGLCAYIRQHVKVVLGGDGGDELFGGYDRYYGNIYASYLAMLPAPVRRHVLGKLLDLLPEGGWYQSTGHKLKWLNKMSLFAGAERYAKSLSYFYFSETYHPRLYTPSFLAGVQAFDPEYSIKHYFDVAKADDVIDRMLHSDAMIRMPDHPVMVLDRMSMAHGLEARAPFLDHKLTEFCARIPSAMKVQGKRRRIIQMALAKRYLPESVLKRKKQGFASPIVYLLRDEFNHLYDKLLLDARLANENIVQRELLSTLLAEHKSGQADHGQRLWLLCSAEIWYRMYIDNQSVAQLTDYLAA